MLRRPMTLPMLAAQPLPCPCPNTHWGAVGPRGLGLGPAHAVPLFPPSAEPPEPRRGSCSLCSPRTELGHQRHAKGIRWAWGTGRTRCSKRLGVWARKYHKKRKDQKQNQTESQAGDDKVSRQRFYLLGGGRGGHPARGRRNNRPFCALQLSIHPGGGETLPRRPRVPPTLWEASLQHPVCVVSF